MYLYNAMNIVETWASARVSISITGWSVPRYS